MSSGSKHRPSISFQISETDLASMRAVVNQLQQVNWQELEKVRQTAQVFAAKIHDVGQQVKLALERLKDVQPALNYVLEVIQKSSPDLKKIFEHIKLYDVVDSIGWLPHWTTPISIVEEFSNDPTRLDEELGQYYVSNWGKIEQQFREKIESYDICFETRLTFFEALDAHRYGLYRSVVRTLLIEIERAVRVQSAIPIHQTITSQRDLIDAANILTMRELGSIGLSGLKLFSKLSSHLYEKVKNEEQFAKFSDHAVPNRHAAVHGIIDYKTSKNSINTLIMVDYALRILHLAKENQQRHGATQSLG